MKPFTKTLVWCFFLGVLAACNNANVQVSGMKTSINTNSLSLFKASGSNPINADSFGAVAGTSSPSNYIVKVKVNSQWIDPTTPTTPGGYHVSAKVVKW